MLVPMHFEFRNELGVDAAVDCRQVATDRIVIVLRKRERRTSGGLVLPNDQPGELIYDARK
jgi:hypothetical protein